METDMEPVSMSDPPLRGRTYGPMQHYSASTGRQASAMTQYPSGSEIPQSPYLGKAYWVMATSRQTTQLSGQPYSDLYGKDVL